tara:strand:+ start:731 stop:955 length:225 start_codon:yes stop_codon:yes gene_type:complete
MVYDLTEISNMVVVIAGAIGSLLLIVFQSRCKRICWGCITRDLEPLKPKGTPISEAPALQVIEREPEPEPEPEP